jgi:nucleoside-diphosphate-sugar epimerase
LALKAPLESVRGQIFNVVGFNHKINEIGEMVKTLIPGTKMNRLDGALDRRDYRVSADKARQVLGFRPGFGVPDGIRELADALTSGAIEYYKDKKYYNIHAFGEDQLNG